MVAVQLREQSSLEAEVSRLRAENARLKRLITTDPLTRIPNRLAFDRALKRQWQRAIRNQSGLSILLMDLDHFKQHNDTHGHPAGDRLLRQCAQTWALIPRRPGDVVARYGGEEFGVILPDTGRHGAVKIAEALLTDTRRLGVTVSIGVVSCQAVASAPATALVEAADTALYRAKAEGRDRFVVAGE